MPPGRTQAPLQAAPKTRFQERVARLGLLPFPSTLPIYEHLGALFPVNLMIELGNIMAATLEKTVWNGTPSQVVNIGTFVICGLFFWLLFPLFIMLWRWLVVKNTKYELTNERLRTRHGVLNKKTDELELYRVRDYKLDQPFFLRFFSLGNIVLLTSDKTHSTVTLQAISGGEELREKIRAFVEQCRMKKRVREVDFE
jgi:uncharacterized membrane protein YdbT with pleckstrin-like domain